MNFRDVEQLSAYLDGKLDPSEVAHLEARLVASEALRLVLDDLRVARGLLRRVPRRKAPRNFTLRPTDARVRAPLPRIVSPLRYAGAIASLLFAFAFGFNAFGPGVARMLASAPPVGYGMGGAVGGGAPDEAYPPAAEGPTTLQAQPTPGAEAAAPMEMATEEAFAKSAPAEEPAADAIRAGPAPVAPVWLLLLAIAAIVLISLAWYLDRTTRRNFRSRELEK